MSSHIQICQTRQMTSTAVSTAKATGTTVESPRLMSAALDGSRLLLLLLLLKLRFSRIASRRVICLLSAATATAAYCSLRSARISLRVACARFRHDKQDAAVLTAKGHIAAAIYRIRLRISIARRIFPILHNGPRDAPEIVPCRKGIRAPIVCNA